MILRHTQTSIVERNIEPSFPCFFMNQKLSGMQYVMLSNDNTAVMVYIFTAIEGATINAHCRVTEKELSEYFLEWQPCTQKEFASVLQRATEQIEAHFPNELKKTIKEISY